MFNRCYIGRVGIPESWREAVLVPIYKGAGDVKSLDNYRGLLILTAMYKIYATLICRRLDKACEKGHIRARSQCGFRSGTGTTTASFAMHHAIHASCCSASQGGIGACLYVCFIDFAKAFDTVPRDKMWHRLAEIGVISSCLKL